MKYSKEIESLIDSVIAKGVISEQDRNSIVRKAVIQGFDPEQLNAELDIRLRSVAIPKEPTHLTTSSEDKNHSMFSKELESLIHATLEDGVLEEYEKAALVKRAQSEGADLAELEIYINSLLQKRARELENVKNAERKNAEKEKREAFGRKCPSCGAQVPPLTLKCECGYEFTTQKHVSSVQLLSDKIDKIIMAPMKNTDPDDDKYMAEKQERNKNVRDTITVFPVPNTKEDIIEFLALSAPNSKIKGGLLGTIKGRLMIATPIAIISIMIVCIAMIAVFGKVGEGLLAGLVYGSMAAYGVFHVCLKKGTDIIEDNKTAEVWRSKFDQVLMKGRSLRGDPEFQRQLDYYENQLNS